MLKYIFEFSLEFFLVAVVIGSPIAVAALFVFWMFNV